MYQIILELFNLSIKYLPYIPGEYDKKNRLINLLIKIPKNYCKSISNSNIQTLI